MQPGMVLCIEPTLEYEPGKIVLHEEAVVVTERLDCSQFGRRSSKLDRERLDLVDDFKRAMRRQKKSLRKTEE
ncbi:hypothetical protein X758_32865 [Mesorhizobium sp. LSHC416B00]|nr:hypothetical protein X761_33150 [Mesorhizobium sp. LSHC424B00]ESX63899.1 hypothetical protein X758_32865 [Mesorhizobium sp. LSHC416B00]